MTTELETIDQPEVHEAKVMLTDTAPIQFEVTSASIAQMRAHAAGLSIAGPDDKVGHKTVYDYRQVVARQRTAVKKKQDALKRPHIDYNRKVDATANPLIEELTDIVDSLARQEKAYNDERERLAEEAAKAARVRYAQRVSLLQNSLFIYDAELNTFSFGAVIINVDDIRDFSDEEYQPTVDLVAKTYADEVERRKGQVRIDERTNQRIHQLLEYGFRLNKPEAIYELIDSDGVRQYSVSEAYIRELSDEEYVLVADNTARRVDQIRAAADQKAAAQRAEADRMEQQRIDLENQQAELKRQQDAFDAERQKLQDEKDAALLQSRVDRLLAAGFTQDDKGYQHDGLVRVRTGVILSFDEPTFDSVIADAEARNRKAEQKRLDDEAAEAQRVKDVKQTEKDRIKADKERTARLKPERKDFAKYLACYVHANDLEYQQPEITQLADRFFGRIVSVVAETKAELDAL